MKMKLLLFFAFLLNTCAPAYSQTINADYIRGVRVEKNYIKGGDAESDFPGFTCYADAAGARPVDGTGGSPVVTMTSSATTPLSGLKSWIYTKDAADRQGNGCSYPFTIDSKDKAKVLQISIDWTVASGTYSGGTSSTDSDVIVDLYDVTNAAIIEPSSVKLDGSVSGTNYSYKAVFQTSSTSSSYRLILHSATTSASAFTLKLDNISVSEQVVNQGGVITEWKSFTPTGSWTTNTTYTGKYRRVGDTLEVQTYLALAGAPTATALLVDLPAGHTIDTAKLAFGALLHEGITATASAIVGSVEHKLFTYVNNTTRLGLLYLSSVTTAQEASVNATTPVTWASGNSIVVNYTVPIVGWGAVSTVGQDTDTRVVAMKAHSSSTTIGTSDTDVIFPTAEFDTHGAYNTSTGVYTVPVAGKYRICAFLEGGSVSASGTNARASSRLFKNGSSAGVIGRFAYQVSSVSLNPSYSGCISTDAVSGDLLKISSSRDAAISSYSLAGSTSVYFLLERLSGPSAIAASETVTAYYETTAGQSIPNSGTAVVLFDTKVWDSHNAMNTSTGEYTCPISGTYEMTSSNFYTTSTYAGGERAFINIYKGGTRYKGIAGLYNIGAGSLNAVLNGGGQVKCLAGEKLTIVVANSRTAGATTLNTLSNALNWVDIKRVGNY